MLIFQTAVLISASALSKILCIVLTAKLLKGHIMEVMIFIFTLVFFEVEVTDWGRIILVMFWLSDKQCIKYKLKQTQGFSKCLLQLFKPYQYSLNILLKVANDF